MGKMLWRCDLALHLGASRARPVPPGAAHGPADRPSSRRGRCQTAAVEKTEYLAHLTADGRRLLEIARTAPAATVPACPGWDVLRLAGHLGRVHRMAAASVRDRLDAPPANLTRPPEDLDGVLAYGSAGLDEVVAALTAASPDDPAWNFTPSPQVASFWFRRMACETVVHRVDAEQATGVASSVDAALAVDAIEEYLTLMLPRAILNKKLEGLSIGGSLHLHATDAPGEWMIRLEGGSVDVEHGHGKGDAAVRGTASDLLLAVWARRSPVTDPGYEIFGDKDVAQRFFAVGGN